MDAICQGRRLLRHYGEEIFHGERSRSLKRQEDGPTEPLATHRSPTTFVLLHYLGKLGSIRESKDNSRCMLRSKISHGVFLSKRKHCRLFLYGRQRVRYWFSVWWSSSLLSWIHNNSTSHKPFVLNSDVSLSSLALSVASALMTAPICLHFVYTTKMMTKFGDTRV